MSWKKVKIGNVLKQYRIEHWVQNDKIYKQVSILNDGSVVLRGEKIGKEIGRKRQFIIDTDKYPKTLIFTRQLLLQGSIGIASSDVNGCIVTENMPMFSIEGIEIDFLTFFIRTELFKSQVRSLETSGTAQKSLHERQFLDLEIPLPTLKEQKKIIALCKLGKNNFEKINEEISQQQFFLQQLRQAILQEAVQGKLTQQNKDDEPADKLLQRIKAEKQKLIAAGKLKKEKELPPITKDEIPFELPKGWVWCRLGEISNILRGASPRPKGDPRYFSLVETEYNWISISDITKFSENNILKKTREYLTALGTTMSNKVEMNEFIIAVSGSTTGKCCLTGITGYIYDGLAVVRLLQNKILEEYLLLYMLKFYEYINNSKEGSSFPNINTDFLKNLLISIPPLAEQQRIVTKVQQLLQMTNELEQQVTQSQTQAQQLLQAVLKEAFTRKPVMYAANDLLTLAAEE